MAQGVIAHRRGRRTHQVDAEEVEDASRVGVAEYLSEAVARHRRRRVRRPLQHVAGEAVERQAGRREADQAALGRSQRARQHAGR